jgi:hypothetical protein
MYTAPLVVSSHHLAAVVWPKIMGMNMFVFGGLCLLVLAMLGTMWVMVIQSRNKRAVKGHLNCEFMNKGGNAYNLLLPESNGVVEAPVEHKVPGGRYFVHPKRLFDSVYPPNTWGVWQVPCKKIYFAEGNPDPIDPFEKEPLVTALLLHNSINEKFSQLMLESANELYDKLEDVIKMMKLNPTIVYVGLGLAVLLSGVAAWFSFKVSSLMIPPVPK